MRMFCDFFYLFSSFWSFWKLEELKSRWIERFLPSSTDSIYFSSRISNFPRALWIVLIWSCVFSLPFLARKKTIPHSFSTSLTFPTMCNFPGSLVDISSLCPFQVFEEKVVCSRNLGLELSSKHGFYLCGMTCGISWSRNFIDLEEIEANSWDEFPPQRNWQQKLPWKDTKGTSKERN